MLAQKHAATTRKAQARCLKVREPKANESFTFGEIAQKKLDAGRTLKGQLGSHSKFLLLDSKVGFSPTPNVQIIEYN